ncbi:hypothetical protein CFOL_v3_00988, partial [Cephalotus follicularis]
SSSAPNSIFHFHLIFFKIFESNVKFFQFLFFSIYRYLFRYQPSIFHDSRIKMGIKRPFDDESQELSFKQSRQLDYSYKLTQFTGFVPCNDGHQKPNVSGEKEGGYKSKCLKASEGDITTEISNLADKELENSAPLSWLTSSSSDEDVGSGATVYSSLSPEYFEFDFPRRTFVPFDDPYSSLLNRSPRRQVPLGPNHQADIPLWVGHMMNDKLDLKESYNPNSSSFFSGSDHVIDDACEEKLMGTCVIPMPNSYIRVHNSYRGGIGRGDCSCPDEGSVRCVRRHVTEAREKLMKTLGHEKFVKLGFDEMGEEVARKWSDKEQLIYHEVVYSYPASSGRNFWKHLSAVFPSRSKKDIVSYYFNVFMLRTRAAQNRSNFLDIDSDDDEWHGIKRTSYGGQVSEEDDDSAVESPIDQANQEDNEDDSPEGDDENDDDNDDGDVGYGSGDVTGDDSGIDHALEAHATKSYHDDSFDLEDRCTDKISGSDGEDYNAKNDSCMSFEFQPNTFYFCGTVDSGSTSQATGVKTDLRKCFRSDFDGCNDLAGNMYLLEPSDVKVFDARYPLGPIEGVDLLPTCNIIEEIFGQDSKTRN